MLDSYIHFIPLYQQLIVHLCQDMIQSDMCPGTDLSIS